MKKETGIDWLKFLNSVFLVALIPIGCKTLVYTKGIYDKVNEVVVLKRADHSDWITMKAVLSENEIKDKIEHSDLYKKYSDLNMDVTTLMADVSRIEQKQNEN